jgi:hypothetical protein
VWPLAECVVSLATLGGAHALVLPWREFKTMALDHTARTHTSSRVDRAIQSSGAHMACAVRRPSARMIDLVWMCANVRTHIRRVAFALVASGVHAWREVCGQIDTQEQMHA